MLRMMLERSPGDCAKARFLAGFVVPSIPPESRSLSPKNIRTLALSQPPAIPSLRGNFCSLDHSRQNDIAIFGQPPLKSDHLQTQHGIPESDLTSEDIIDFAVWCLQRYGRPHTPDSSPNKLVLITAIQ